MTDTIAAIATGMGGSGIGIIRISGDMAIQIADKIFVPNNKNKKVSDMRTYTAAFGHISYDGHVYDEAVCLVMRSPHSYTTEDIVGLTVTAALLC